MTLWDFFDENSILNCGIRCSFWWKRIKRFLVFFNSKNSTNPKIEVSFWYFCTCEQSIREKSKTSRSIRISQRRKRKYSILHVSSREVFNSLETLNFKSLVKIIANWSRNRSINKIVNISWSFASASHSTSLLGTNRKIFFENPIFSSCFVNDRSKKVKVSFWVKSNSSTENQDSLRQKNFTKIRRYFSELFFVQRSKNFGNKAAENIELQRQLHTENRCECPRDEEF